MRTQLVCALVSLAVFGAAAVVGAVEVPLARIGQLMSTVADTPGAPRDQIGTVLRSLMDEILTYLEGQGVPEDALASLEEGFSRALAAFLAGEIPQGEFGAEIAALARELAKTAKEGGIAGLPVALIERIGLNPAAILALQGEKELTGLEVAALAQTIIGSLAPAALPAGPPEWVPAWGAQGGEGDTGGPPPGIPAGPPSGIPVGGKGEGGDDDENRGSPRGRP